MMPQNKGMYYLVGLIVLLLAGCSTGSDSGEVFTPESGHVDRWANIDFFRTAEFHGSAVREVPGLSRDTSEVNAVLCAECHGADLDGGISRVSCFSCHLGPDGRAGHRQDWMNKNDFVHFHGNYARDFGISCTSFCHGDDLRGGVGPSCFLCHDTRTLADILAEIADLKASP